MGVSLSVNTSLCVSPLFLWSCWQCVDVLILFNEQISWLTPGDNEKQHRRKRQRVPKQLFFLRTLLVLLRIRPPHVYVTCYRWPSQTRYHLNLYEYTDSHHTVWLETVELTCIQFWKLLKTTFLTDRAPALSYPSVPPGLSPWRRFMRHGGYEDVWRTLHGPPGVILEVERRIQSLHSAGCFILKINWILYAANACDLLPDLICSVQLDVPSVRNRLAAYSPCCRVESHFWDASETYRGPAW